LTGPGSSWFDKRLPDGNKLFSHTFQSTSNLPRPHHENPLIHAELIVGPINLFSAERLPSSQFIHDSSHDNRE
jgi:hypothetical protein